jgi:hypothetical protein
LRNKTRGSKRITRGKEFIASIACHKIKKPVQDNSQFFYSIEIKSTNELNKKTPTDFKRLLYGLFCYLFTNADALNANHSLFSTAYLQLTLNWQE